MTTRQALTRALIIYCVIGLAALLGVLVSQPHRQLLGGLLAAAIILILTATIRRGAPGGIR